MFEVLKSGGVYVTDVVDADEFNIHNNVIGGVYDEEENRASGSTDEGARGRQGHSPERVSAGAERGSEGANDSLVGAEPDRHPRRDQPEVARRSESQQTSKYLSNLTPICTPKRITFHFTPLYSVGFMIRKTSKKQRVLHLIVRNYFTF